MATKFTYTHAKQRTDLLTSLLAFLRTYIYLRRGASDEQTFEYRQRHNTFKPPCMVYVRAMKPHISNTCLWYGFQNLIPNPQSHTYGIAIAMATKSRINTKTNLVCFWKTSHQIQRFEWFTGWSKKRDFWTKKKHNGKYVQRIIHFSARFCGVIRDSCVIFIRNIRLENENALTSIFIIIPCLKFGRFLFPLLL